jgi:hypothetical protein
LPPAFMLVSCFAYYSTLKMEETCSSEMLVDFQRTTRRYIPQDRTFQTNSFVLSTSQAHIQLPIRAPTRDYATSAFVSKCCRHMIQLHATIDCVALISRALHIQRKIRKPRSSACDPHSALPTYNIFCGLRGF